MGQSFPMNTAMIQAAYDLAESRAMCCKADLDLLLTALDVAPANSHVVQLGAGSGTMALAILGHDNDTRLTTIDYDEQNLGWEGLALANMGFDDRSRHATVEGNSHNADTLARSEVQDIDLLVVDADHSYEGVKTDLEVWMPSVRLGGLIFLHDYDGTTAPHQYPGVRKAADEVLHRPPFKMGGWSAIFVK